MSTKKLLELIRINFYNLLNTKRATEVVKPFFDLLLDLKLSDKEFTEETVVKFNNFLKAVTKTNKFDINLELLERNFIDKPFFYNEIEDENRNYSFKKKTLFNEIVFSFYLDKDLRREIIQHLLFDADHFGEYKNISLIHFKEDNTFSLIDFFDEQENGTTDSKHYFASRKKYTDANINDLAYSFQRYFIAFENNPKEFDINTQIEIILDEFVKLKEQRNKLLSHFSEEKLIELEEKILLEIFVPCLKNEKFNSLITNKNKNLMFESLYKIYKDSKNVNKSYFTCFFIHNNIPSDLKISKKIDLSFLLSYKHILEDKNKMEIINKNIRLPDFDKQMTESIFSRKNYLVNRFINKEIKETNQSINNVSNKNFFSLLSFFNNEVILKNNKLYDYIKKISLVNEKNIPNKIEWYLGDDIFKHYKDIAHYLNLLIEETELLVETILDKGIKTDYSVERVSYNYIELNLILNNPLLMENIYRKDESLFKNIYDLFYKILKNRYAFSNSYNSIHNMNLLDFRRVGEDNLKIISTCNKEFMEEYIAKSIEMFLLECSLYEFPVVSPNEVIYKEFMNKYKYLEGEINISSILDKIDIEKYKVKGYDRNKFMTEDNKIDSNLEIEFTKTLFNNLKDIYFINQHFTFDSIKENLVKKIFSQNISLNF